MSDIGIFLAALLSAVVGSMGMGGGGVLIIWLTMTGTEPIAARGINLLFFIPAAVIALIIHIKNGLVDAKRVIPAALAGLVGAVPGVWLSGRLNTDISSKMFALLLIFMGLREVTAAFKLSKEKN